MSATAFTHVLSLHIGARIRALREAKGLHQRELAVLMDMPGMGRSHVTRLESGKHLIRIDILCAVARALGVEVSELLQCLDGVRPQVAVSEAAE